VRPQSLVTSHQNEYSAFASSATNQITAVFPSAGVPRCNLSMTEKAIAGKAVAYLSALNGWLSAMHCRNRIKKGKASIIGTVHIELRSSGPVVDRLVSIM